jgi:hypothetical protein
MRAVQRSGILPQVWPSVKIGRSAKKDYCNSRTAYQRLTFCSGSLALTMPGKLMRRSGEVFFLLTLAEARRIIQKRFRVPRDFSVVLELSNTGCGNTSFELPIPLSASW